MMEGRDYYEDDKEDLIEDTQRKSFANKTLGKLTSSPARFFYLGLACITLGLLLPMWFLYYYPLDFQARVYTRGSCMIAPEYRFPCMVGKANVTMTECAETGCCWYDDGDGAASRCFHSLPASFTYKVDMSNHSSTQLNTVLKAYSYSSKVAGEPAKTPYGNTEHPKVSAQVWCPSTDHAILQMGPSPQPSVGDPIVLNGELNISSNIGKNYDFYVMVKRNSTGRTLVDTRLGATIISDLFSEITLVPGSSQIYGLGQAFHPSLRRNVSSQLRTALFARPLIFTEGSYPFYMCVEPDGLVHGVYLETSAPLEVQMLPGPTITFRVLGANIKLHVFAGPTPAAVSEQYTRLVGRPRIPPVWSLGFHMCRQGDPESFQEVMETMVNRSIPFESDCVDADAFVPLGFDIIGDVNDTFKEAVNDLHSLGRRVVAVTVPHLPLEKQPLGDDEVEDYEPYLAANQSGILISNSNETGNFFGELLQATGNRTWNVSYVDYTNPTVSTWLNPLYAKLQQEYHIDGFYLMQNAPVNDAFDNCTEDNLPFVPNLTGSYSSLSNHTICMSAQQSDGPHLGLHNRYGQNHTKAVRDAAEAMDNSSNLFLTSEATSPGSGAVGGQLAASLTADWTSLKLALVQALELGLYGVPQNGYPICGSLNSTQITLEGGDDYQERIEALCLIWYQLSPYLPLAVSYYQSGHFARNPTQLSDAFLNQALVQISQRYVFVPYHYTLQVEASLTGVPPLRPLWYEFPDDNTTWGIDQQLLLGEALMVAPALLEKQREVTLYLPGECWYEYFQGFRPKADSGPAWVKLPAPAAQTLIYQRASTVIFNQEPHTTIEEQRQQGSYSVNVALSCEGNYTADGILWLPGDDTSVISPAKVELSVRNTTVTITSFLNAAFCDYSAQKNYVTSLEQIKIFGILEDIVSLNATLTDNEGHIFTHSLNITQNDRPPSLLITDLPIDWCDYTSTVIEWE